VRPGLADDGVAVERAAVAQLFVAGSKVPLLPRSDIGNVYSWFASADAVVRENLTVRAHGTVRCAPFRLPSEYSGHVTQHFFGGAAAPDGAGAAPVPRLPLLAAEHRGAGKFWRRHGLDGRPVLAVHRGASAPAKRWAEDGYRAVTQWWRERGGAVLEVCGPLESPVPLSPEHVLAQDLALGDLAALLARVDLFLGGDTGVSHLAGAVGAAGVVLFGPTRPRTWRPLGGRLVCLRRRPADVDTDGGPPISLRLTSPRRVMRALAIVAGFSRTLRCGCAPHLDKEGARTMKSADDG
jgi:hypothetical protein